MATWTEVAAQVPELAAAVRARFAAGKHCTLATLRKDGSPRISGTEVEFGDDLWLGSMPGAVKALDLRRDGRFALHSPTVDPPEDNPSAWVGEAKVAGRAVETSDRSSRDQPHRFRLDISEVVLTRVVGDELEIQSWQADRGFRVRRRH